jgi:hypothetical protein
LRALERGPQLLTFSTITFIRLAVAPVLEFWATIPIAALKLPGFS